ncbi:hypothetical protein H4R35_006827 [Dimargaris xerosporica]|nr:hypothetical protein H4R35_006827 [Dimargaris xerosporica]
MLHHLWLVGLLQAIVGGWVVAAVDLHTEVMHVELNSDYSQVVDEYSTLKTATNFTTFGTLLDQNAVDIGGILYRHDDPVDSHINSHFNIIALYHPNAVEQFDQSHTNIQLRRANTILFFANDTALKENIAFEATVIPTLIIPVDLGLELLRQLQNLDVDHPTNGARTASTHNRLSIQLKSAAARAKEDSESARNEGILIGSVVGGIAVCLCLIVTGVCICYRNYCRQRSVRHLRPSMSDQSSVIDVDCKTGIPPLPKDYLPLLDPAQPLHASSGKSLDPAVQLRSLYQRNKHWFRLSQSLRGLAPNSSAAVRDSQREATIAVPTPVSAGTTTPLAPLLPTHMAPRVDGTSCLIGSQRVGCSEKTVSQPTADNDLSADSGDSDEKSTLGPIRARGAVPSSPTCAICLDAIAMGSTNAHIRVLPCHHLYHDDCIDQWLTTKSGCCPLCKFDCTIYCRQKLTRTT